MSDDNFLDKAVKDFVGDDEEREEDGEFYSKDVQAAAIADNNMDPEILEDDTEEEPVTSDNLSMGNMDDDAELNPNTSDSYDEENMPGGDNVVN